MSGAEQHITYFGINQRENMNFQRASKHHGDFTRSKMVISITIPLKASEEAIVEFLLRIVFGPQRNLNSQSNQRECLRHDVLGASRLINWILRNEKINRNSLTVACNLVYGNTIVLRTQVARLLYDAIRAREIVAFTSFLVEEEEKKRKTREQMERGIEDDFKTPRKRIKSNVFVNDDLINSPSPISVALKQNITMPDVFSHRMEDYAVAGDDLAPPTREQLEALYGMLDSENRNSVREKTFLDLYSGSGHENFQDLNANIEFERPTEEFIREQLQTPVKGRQDDVFEPAANLNEILLFGRLPFLAEGDQRRSMDDEMEDIRHHGHNADFVTPHRMEVPRYVSEQLDLDDRVYIPKRTPKTPRSAVKLLKAGNENENDGVNHKVPLRETHQLMEDYSSLHYKNTEPFFRKTNETMNLKDLLDPIPFCLKKNKHVYELFNGHGMFNSEIGNGVSDSEDGKSNMRPNSRQNASSENLDPIDSSQLKFIQTPLKNKSPTMSPLRPIEDIEMREEVEIGRLEEMEFQRTEELERPRLGNDSILEQNWCSDRQWASPLFNERSSAEIRNLILEELSKQSPFPAELDAIILNSVTRREAARSFYAILELLKDRVISVSQKTPFGSINLTLSGNDSEDIEVLAMEKDVSIDRI